MVRAQWDLLDPRGSEALVLPGHSHKFFIKCPTLQQDLAWAPSKVRPGPMNYCWGVQEGTPRTLRLHMHCNIPLAGAPNILTHSRQLG